MPTTKKEIRSRRAFATRQQLPREKSTKRCKRCRNPFLSNPQFAFSLVSLRSSTDERFNTLESDLIDLIDSIKQRLRDADSRPRQPPTSASAHHSFLRSTERQFDQAATILRQMHSEAAAAVPSQRVYLDNQSASYRAELDALRQRLDRFAKARREADYKREMGAQSLLSPDDDDTSGRQRVLDASAALHRTSESIGRSMVVANESEQVGTQVIGQLTHQREQLHRAQDALDDTNRDVGRSRAHIRTLALGAVTNKLLLMVIIGIECMALGGIVYLRFL